MALDRSRLSHLDEQLSQLQSSKNSTDVIQQTQDSLADLFEHSTVTSSDLDEISRIKKSLSQKNSPKLKEEITLLTTIENSIQEIKNKNIPDRSLDDHHGTTIENSLLTSTGGTFDHIQIKSFAYTSNNETVTGSISLDGKGSKTLTRAQTIAIYYTDENNKQTKIGTLLYNPKNTRLNFDESTLETLGIESIKFATNTTFSLQAGVTLQNQKTHTIQTGSKKKQSGGQKSGSGDGASSPGGTSSENGTTTNTTTEPNNTNTTDPKTGNITIHNHITGNTENTTQMEAMQAQMQNLQAQVQALQSQNSNNNNININGGAGLSSGINTHGGIAHMPPHYQLALTEQTINQTNKKVTKKIKKIKKIIQKAQEGCLEAITKQGADITKIKKQLTKLEDIKTSLEEQSKQTQEKLDNMGKTIKDMAENMDERDKNLADSINTTMEEKLKDIEKSIDDTLNKHNDNIKDIVDDSLQKNNKTIFDKMKDMFDNRTKDNSAEEKLKEKEEELKEKEKRIKELEEELKKKKKKENKEDGETEEGPENITTSDDVIKKRKKDIATTLSLDAHLMDKKLLVKKSVHQDILQKTQERYAKAGLLKKFGMFMVNRPLQAIREKNTMSQLIDNNEFIESDNTLQSRVAGSIGTFAEEAKMGLSEESIEIERKGEDKNINNIAKKYLLRTISKTQAIDDINQALKENSELSMGVMTGTDIIEQLDEKGMDYGLRLSVSSVVPSGKITNDHRKNIIDAIRSFLALNPNGKLIEYDGITADNTPKELVDELIDDIKKQRNDEALESIEVNVNLIGIRKKYGPELGGTETETNRKDTIGKFFSNGTGGVIPYGMAAARAARALTYGTLTASGVGLPLALAGAIGTSGIIQYFKTYHDTLKESQNIHEKAIHMGPEELQTQLNNIQRDINKCSGLNKTLGRAFGRGKHRRLVKQQALYQSINDNINQLDHNNKQYILKKSSDIIDGLRRTDVNSIIDLLARISAGKDHGTNFISGSSRELNETERKEIMIELRKAGGKLPGRPAANAGPEVWNKFWKTLITSGNNKRLYDETYNDLSRAHLNLTRDVDDNRESKAIGDAKRTMLASTAITGTIAAAGGIVNGSRPDVTTDDVIKDVRTIEGEHIQYDIGKHTGGTPIHGSSREMGIAQDAHLTIDGEAAVDALVTRAGSYPTADLLADKTTLTSDIASSPFNEITQNALQDAIDGEMTKLAAEATRVGADPGNVNLVQHRRMRMVKTLMDDLSLAGKTDITIDKINFDPDEFADATGDHAININESIAGSTGDIVDRATAFNVHIKELVPGGTTTGARYTRRPGDPRRVFWPSFANTYARPGRKQQSRTPQHKSTMSQKRRNKFLQWRNKEKNKQRERATNITQEDREHFEHWIVTQVKHSPDPNKWDKYYLDFSSNTATDGRNFVNFIYNLQKEYLKTLPKEQRKKLQKTKHILYTGGTLKDDYKGIYDKIQKELYKT